ncbi:MAG TPA: hypothetical protein VF215_11025 [Thermoanaerobaculia bacterium]
MHRRVSLLFLVALIAACGSAGSGRPAAIAAPEIRAGVAGTIFFGSGSTAPANIDVEVTNVANVPITLRRVEVDSPGMGTYALRRASRIVRETIAPGETKRVTVFATAVTTVRNPSEPLTIRVIAEFENGKDRWREITFAR